ncbi:MAG: hypothetical protein R3325_12350 [Thermoanaerobaculia bacterium]|nr:hypothetical protein [Thermoanaerobaculia bacterium]
MSRRAPTPAAPAASAAATALLLLLLCPLRARAGGAWLPEPGHGEVQLGLSVKTAATSWSPRGEVRRHDSEHDFRYLYTGGEVGVSRRLSLSFLLLYLDGYEGPPGDQEHNAGFSEAFLGAKLRLRQGRWPMAIAFRLRTSYLYDLPGPYDRHLFGPDEDDLDGDVEEAVFRGVSPEWRGLLGEDYGVSFLASRSLCGGGWVNLELGYNYRTTNLSDEIPLLLEVGHPLPWRDLVGKVAVRWVQSVGNESPGRDPEDRFGCSPRNCFPDASVVVVGAGLFRDFGRDREWWVEAGFNQWVWGRSARRYQEPYLSIGRRF